MPRKVSRIVRASQPPVPKNGLVDSDHALARLGARFVPVEGRRV